VPTLSGDSRFTVISSTKAYAEVAVVQRALDLLEALAEQDPAYPEIGVSELARRVKLSKSTTARLVSNLAVRGYVEQNPETAKCSLGPALLLSLIHKSEPTRHLRISYCGLWV
jgi:DNA-binding IclR family transcriptional regulator